MKALQLVAAVARRQLWSRLASWPAPGAQSEWAAVQLSMHAISIEVGSDAAAGC